MRPLLTQVRLASHLVVSYAAVFKELYLRRLLKRWLYVSLFVESLLLYLEGTASLENSVIGPSFDLTRTILSEIKVSEFSN